MILGGAATTMIRLELSSHPVVVLATGERQMLAPRDAALLAWLAIEGPTPRARLAALLWPASDADAARNTLRQRLFQLRRHCGELVRGQATLELLDGVRLDLDDGEPLLGEQHFGDAPELDAWLHRQRQRRRASWRADLERQAEVLAQAGEFAAALRIVDTLLAADPLDESAHRRAMHLHYLRGDRAAALLAFDRCERVLKDEVGARPSPETLALLATIERATVAAPAPAPALPASVLRPPRLVGRDRELAALQQAWATGQVAWVSGEAGLGKTRLLQELAAIEPGLAYAAARPGDTGVPFATLARLLRAIGAREQGPAADDTPAAPAHLTVTRLLPELDAAGLRPAAEGQRLLLQRALQGWAGSRAGLRGLLVDDLHFADDASLEMLASLIAARADAPEGGQAPRWALACRPAEAGSALQALLDGLTEQGGLAMVELRPLPAPALAALLDSLGLPGVEGAALAPALQRRTGGNPMFVLETIKHAWAERRLQDLGDAGALPHPPGVRRLIARRLAALSPGAVALARVAAVAGPDFGIALAEHVLGTSALRFADALAELEAAQVLRGMQFAHDLVLEAVREGVPAAIAEHTHAGIAGWLETHAGEPARVARHWIDGGQPQRALPWLQRAADAAGAALRHREQIAFMDELAGLQQQLGERAAAVATTLAMIDLLSTHDDGAARCLALCDRLDALADSAGARVQARLRRAHALHMLGRLGESEPLAQEALRMAQRERVGTALVVEARLQLATVYTLLDRSAAAVPMFDAAQSWVDEHADDAQRCEFHANFALALDNLGRLADASPHHVTAIELAQRSGHHGNLTMCLSNHAANRILAGRLGEGGQQLARMRLERAQADSESSVDGFAAMLQAICDMQSGRYRAALAQLDLAEQRLAQYAPGWRHAVLAHRGSVWAQLGQWARLQQLLAEIGEPAALSAASRLRARHLRMQLDAGRPARGRAAQDGVPAELTDKLGEAMPDLRHALRLDAARALAPADALREAEAVADAAAALGQQGTVLAARARAAAWAGQAGDAGRALQHADAAMALAQQVQPVRQYPAETWLHCALAYGAAGRESKRRQTLAQGVEWVRRVARDEVPDEFRDGFLHRNRSNVRLLALAASAAR